MKSPEAKAPGAMHGRCAVTIAALLLAGLAWPATTRSAEIIPSIGYTRSVDGDEDLRMFGGVAFRGELLPILKHEIGVSYRSESMFNDQLHVRMWPVTASLWLTPVPALYAGAGVGFYHVTLDYDDDLVPPLEDETSQEFGIHVGGGLRVPLAPSAALDLNGRYVMMRDQEARLIPEKFDPDFWSASLGLAIGF